ncbi:MAG: hypothetical protein BWZ08_01949 [candidate division BRC1 bacterium ADurb.BinA292]|nr:MAG: hypothetical protein BWZ08_01949 [candidate division BRC1 bacterium ADurb.BinA292]
MMEFLAGFDQVRPAQVVVPRARTRTERPDGRFNPRVGQLIHRSRRAAERTDAEKADLSRRPIVPVIQADQSGLRRLGGGGPDDRLQHPRGAPLNPVLEEQPIPRSIPRCNLKHAPPFAAQQLQLPTLVHGCDPVALRRDLPRGLTRQIAAIRAQTSFLKIEQPLWPDAIRFGIHRGAFIFALRRSGKPRVRPRGPRQARPPRLVRPRQRVQFDDRNLDSLSADAVDHIQLPVMDRRGDPFIPGLEVLVRRREAGRYPLPADKVAVVEPPAIRAQRQDQLRPAGRIWVPHVERRSIRQRAEYLVARGVGEIRLRQQRGPACPAVRARGMPEARSAARDVMQNPIGPQPARGVARQRGFRTIDQPARPTRGVDRTGGDRRTEPSPLVVGGGPRTPHADRRQPAPVRQLHEGMPGAAFHRPRVQIRRRIDRRIGVRIGQRLMAPEVRPVAHRRDVPGKPMAALRGRLPALAVACHVDPALGIPEIERVVLHEQVARQAGQVAGRRPLLEIG